MIYEAIFWKHQPTQMINIKTTPQTCRLFSFVAWRKTCRDAFREGYKDYKITVRDRIYNQNVNDFHTFKVSFTLSIWETSKIGWRYQAH